MNPGKVILVVGCLLLGFSLLYRKRTEFVNWIKTKVAEQLDKNIECSDPKRKKKLVDTSMQLFDAAPDQLVRALVSLFSFVIVLAVGFNVLNKTKDAMSVSAAMNTTTSLPVTGNASILWLILIPPFLFALAYLVGMTDRGRGGF